ncbi:MAG: hypothetical protein ACR2PR_09050 [Pseudohongiellaceae bacterium]
MAKSGSASSRDRRTADALADKYDYYPTPGFATRALLEKMSPSMRSLHGIRVLEPAAGMGQMARVLREEGGAHVVERDIYDYAADKPTPNGNFLADKDHSRPAWIITNPPFSLLDRFIRRCLAYKSMPSFAMLTRLQALTGKKRGEVFDEFSPSEIFVFRGTVPFARGKVVRVAGYHAVSHCWMVWNRAENGMRLGGRTELSWIDFDAQKRLECDSDYEHEDGKRTMEMLL